MMVGVYKKFALDKYINKTFIIFNLIIDHSQLHIKKRKKIILK